VEYDGLWHRDPAQFEADRRRLNRLTAAGWRVMFVTAADMHRPQELVRRIAAALAV
jgi:very-short-patch-repair endonuclease